MRRLLFTAAFLVCFLMILVNAIPAQCAMVYVKTTGLDTNSGASWELAKKTVQAGLNAAVSGGEVWVAAGTYVQCITLKAGVGLYGGFAGTETLREQRNWTADVTILDGNKAGGVVTSPYGATTTTVIDGFTIRNGLVSTTGGFNDPPGGGGIYCSSSSLTISNNTITRNSGTNYGGGIYCYLSSPTISNNTISGNSAIKGGGIYYEDSHPNVSGNVISENGAMLGGAIYCRSASGAVSNNTISGNSAGYGGAVYCSYSTSPAISNNIIACNSSGIYNDGGSPTFNSNDVYNPNGYNYYGVTDPTGSNGNISVDPRFDNPGYGRWHIQPDSPCRDAGDDSIVQSGWVDMDGQARIQGAHVDMGADETDGTVWSFTPAIVRVSLSGSDSNNGSSWLLAKRTVQAGINAASVVGAEVWVAAGAYNERITLKSYAHVYGGFVGVETQRGQRNPMANVTILDGQRGGSVVTATAPGYCQSVLDGFTIRNGSGTPIRIQSLLYMLGGGIYCSFSSPAISNNTVISNSAGRGGGIYSEFSSPAISNNIVASNSSGGGIYCWYSSPAIFNNIISANNGGICCDSSSPAISNNIISFNSSGIYNYTSGSPVLRNNDVYGNTSYNYSGLSAGVGDISLDPLFVNRAGGDYHLTSASPCIDAGDNAAAPAFDKDGLIRPQDGNGDATAVCDIGAYERPLDLGAARRGYADGTPVSLGGFCVTAVFPADQCVYVEKPDRTVGIRIDTTETFSLAQVLNVSGALQTDPTNGERYVQSTPPWPDPTGATFLPGSLGMCSLALGGGDAGLQTGVWDWRLRPIPGSDPLQYERRLGKAEGVNNIGLLVTIWGSVTEIGADYLYVNDGSGIDYGNPSVKGIYVRGTYSGAVGDFVSVTGASSCRIINGPDGPITVAALRARPGDIVKLR